MNISSLLLSLVKIFNYLVPKNRRNVVFYSRPDYSDNCRIIYEKLQLLKPNYYNCTWIVEDLDSFRKKHPDCVARKHRSLGSLWALYRAKYIVRTHSFWNGIYVPRRQVMCYSFHGMGIKGFEYDIGKRYPHNSFEHFNVTSELFAKMFSECLNADIDRFDVSGLPRNDYLFEQPKELLELLHLDSFEKNIIWMPTFRVNKVFGYQDGEANESGLPVISKLGLNHLNEILLKHNYCLIIKMHQWAAETIEGSWSNIRILTDKQIPEPFTLYHLVGLMDILLTDYSSVSTDFLLLDRPIGYVYDDLEMLRKTRYLPLDPIEQYMAGAQIKDEQQLFNFIDRLNEDSYSIARKRVSEVFLRDKDNKSTERYLHAVGLI